MELGNHYGFESGVRFSCTQVMTKIQHNLGSIFNFTSYYPGFKGMLCVGARTLPYSPLCFLSFLVSVYYSSQYTFVALTYKLSSNRKTFI